MISDDLRSNLLKVCAALNKQDVNYMIIGGAAVGHYGYRRISSITVYKPEIKNDLDFWYNPVLTNYLNIIKALDELGGVDTTELKKQVFDPLKTFIKIDHDTFHTDFLPQLTGVESFRECRKRSDIIILDRIEIPVISYNDLILNKLSIDRPVDKSDIEELNKINKNKPGRKL